MRQPAANRRPASPSQTDSPHLDISALALHLGTTERFIRRLVCERRIPSHKIGKYIRFDQRDVDEWLASSRVDVRA